MRITRTALALAAVLASVALAAPAQASTPTHSDFDEMIFIATVQTHTTIIGTAPERDIHSLGDTVCRTLKSGTTIQKLARAIIKAGVPAGETGVIIGAAADNLCPSQRARVQRYIDNHS